ncbi:MAG: hypothetical protein WAQ28_12950 [Bacteroidia bacterium]
MKKNLLFLSIIATTILFACKKENNTTSQPASPVAHTLHITSNCYNELYLNGTQFWTDSQNNKTLMAKAGDVLKGNYNGGFLNFYLDGATSPTVSSTGYSGTVTYTFK